MSHRPSKPRDRNELIKALHQKCTIGCTQLGGRGKMAPWCELCRAAAAIKGQYDALLRAYETNRRLHRRCHIAEAAASHRAYSGDGRRVAAYLHTELEALRNEVRALSERLGEHCEPWQQELREVPPSTRGIYFIKCGDHIKIGLSRDVRARVRSFEGMPHLVVPLGFIRVDGDLREREAEIHKRFAHIRQGGEWFQDCDELRAFIAAETRPWPRAVAS